MSTAINTFINCESNLIVDLKKMNEYNAIALYYNGAIPRYLEILIYTKLLSNLEMENA